MSEDTERPFTIELDCPPGHPRPGDLLPGVLKGTPMEGALDASDPDVCSFGEWTWVVPSSHRAIYEKCRGQIADRIKALHAQGSIRYGGW